MSLYDIFVKNNIRLARNMVIKANALAHSDNEAIMLKGYAVEADPREWRYYKHIAGQYHFTDKPMKVKSLDTLEEIDFNVENLKIHQATRAAYSYGTRYYRTLVSLYPGQTSLIAGILNPVDIDMAVEADDHQILYYEKDLVEPQEVNLIADLQEWIHTHFDRYTVPGYTVEIGDELYNVARYGVFYANLPLVIMAIREKFIQTNQTHSFHIQQYFASNGGLDKYIPFLTLRQKLYLYRNLRYLRKYSGHKSTFDDLVLNLVTARGLPISRYVMRHNLDAMPDQLRPDIEYHRSPLNRFRGDGGTDIKSTGDLLGRQIPAAVGNVSDVHSDATEIEADMRLSEVATLPTKVVESSLLDMTDSKTYPLTDELFNHWVYLVATNRYTAVVTVTNPVTGNKLTLSAKDALILYIWAFSKAHGLVLTSIPEITARKIRKPKLPTLIELMEKFGGRFATLEQLRSIIIDQPEMETYVSINTFYQFVSEVSAAQDKHRLLYTSQWNSRSRGVLEGATSYCYKDVTLSLGTMDYAAWFANQGIDLDLLGQTELSLLAQSILTTATGAGVNAGTSIDSLQRNMLSLLGEFTSYGVQLLRSINSSSFLVADIPVPRPSGQWLQAKVYTPYSAPTRALDTKQIDRYVAKGFKGAPKVNDVQMPAFERSFSVDSSPDVTAASSYTVRMSVGLARTNFSVDIQPLT